MVESLEAIYAPNVVGNQHPFSSRDDLPQVVTETEIFLDQSEGSMLVPRFGQNDQKA